MSLEELGAVKVPMVYGASKHEQKVTEAPAAVTIVSADEIKKQGYRTLADVLRSVNGVYVTDDRNYSYLGVRGFNRPGDYNSRVLLLVDGHRLNDSVYEQGLYGTEGFLDAEAIERVELIRGPSASIYGDNAFFGVVNVFTRRGRSVDGFEATVEAGDRDTYKAGITFGKQFKNGVELLLSGSIYDTDGEERIFFPEFNSPTNNNGVAVNSDADRAYHFFGSAGYGDFTLSGGWSWRKKIIPTASYLTVFNDGGELTVDERAYVDLKCDHAFSEELRLTGHVAYDVADYHGEYPYAKANTGRVLNLDDARGEWLSTDWQLNWRLANRHTLIFGGDYREHLTLQQGNMDANPPAVHLDERRGGRNAGVFGQAELNLRTNLLLNAGVRVDHYSTFGESVNPRLGLIWQPWTETTLKALYGEAFRAPNAYELYYSYPGQAKANPELKPETIRTYELVWEQSLPGPLRFTAAGYFYQVRSLISQVTDPADNLLVYLNAQLVQARGVELGLEGRGPRGLDLMAGGAHRVFS
jgi:outer membrane receptor for ferrienterochelin and colicins